ncbi:LPXTG cell wall anchor domain-containing protein [Streptomyces sp. Amel2xC10]|uniref:LPXTG cell wall anchor domain-containing protein n=1 Tax=Streptomyces sp. Amel2xC10 TaxID=1305826 RepID=UPI000D1A1DBD|nr:LPXTG cell wall anchor domain-containing protein [Streptomyces sp. Amel2xC10]
MRPCTHATLCLATAAALLAVPARAGAAEEASPRCAGADTGAFPLTTRLRGGPRAYRPGVGHGTWYLDLTNTTDGTCTGIHPVVVLVDARRALEPAQPRLEFYADGRPHPVRFETTDEDELVGAFTEGPEGTAEEFPGFTVGPGRTLSVRLRLALAAGTAPNDVTVNAAVVQRQGDDGEWVGQSNDYRFSVSPDADPDADPDTDSGADPDPDTDPTSTAAPTPSPPARTASPPVRPGQPSAETVRPGTSGDPTRTATASPSGEPADDEELASTGPLPAVALTAAAALLLALGALLVRSRRRP